MMSLKCPWPSFSNSDVAAADRRDEQILVAVVVDVGERRRDADAVGSATPASFVMFRNRPLPEILPELVAADLVDEVDVVEAVAVDVRDRDAGAVVVVNGLVVLAGVVDDPVHERDAAGRLSGR